MWRWSAKENTIFYQDGVCQTFCFWGTSEPNSGGSTPVYELLKTVGLFTKQNFSAENALMWQPSNSSLYDWNDVSDTNVDFDVIIIEYGKIQHS